MPSHSREERQGTHAFIFGRVTSKGTGNGSMVTLRRMTSRQFLDGGRTRLMDSGANRHLHGFQIQKAGSVPIRKDLLELVF